MARESLLDFFEDFAARDDTFVVHDDGYRVREQTYREMASAARRFAAQLRTAGVLDGDKVVVWSENRLEWIAALWGTLLAGAVLVPVDYRASGDLLTRISQIVQARVVLVGDEVTPPASVIGAVWHIRDVGTGQPADTAAAARPTTPRPSGDTLAEIIFTSGATADPKGVRITHRNVLANVIPIEREILKYRRYARPFHPLRFLNLLPLSHMFGQSMATFIPPLLAGTVVFSHGYSPVEIVRQIRSRRVSVLVVVPKVLSVLRDHIQREIPATAGVDPLVGHHWSRRWWHYREVHRLFGWKFWCIVCGAAPLDAELEAFWRKLGFLVVQGYGLTETAPIVTLNHPFRSSKGTVGTPIGGVEVRIAADGEILVRGENVTSGYYQTSDAAPNAQGDAFRDGWFHTGDVGAIDAGGRLTIKGRKKEMIVTPQGLNVFPEDVEQALLAQAGVKEAAVVGVASGGEERIHAVLVLEPNTSPETVVKAANHRLEDHQRVRSTSVWPGAALPRTEGTQKLKRREIQRWVAGEVKTPTSAIGAASVVDIVAGRVGGRRVVPETTLEELGLSSLDRVELMMALEEVFHVTLDESALAGGRTLAEVDHIVRGSDVTVSGAANRGTIATAVRRGFADGPIVFPRWNRSWPARAVRRASLSTWVLPLMGQFMDLTVTGAEHLRADSGPVILAANHQSHLDTPAVLLALPRDRRYRVAPAMAKEFFAAHFNPDAVSRREWLGNTLNYYLACEFFNAFPIPQREAGTRQTLRYIGEVVADGYSILVFPEGRRSASGQIGPFRPGVSMMAARLGVPVVPVRITGLDEVMPTGSLRPKRGPVRVSFGPPLHLEGQDYAALAERVERAVKALP